MKQIQNLLCLFLLAFSFSAFSQQPLPCGTDIVHQRLMQTDVQYRQSFLETQDRIRATINNSSNLHKRTSLQTVPVVVHVIHLGEALGSGSNISDAQITGAIDMLNQRYRNVVGNSIDMELEFCLASRDPNGNPTTGINRVNGSAVANYASLGISVNGSAGASEGDVKSLSMWPKESYYNIWVVHDINGNVAGYAYYPTTYWLDGAVMHRQYMSANSQTLTHELGHAFGLRHTFDGDSDGAACPSNSDCAAEGDLICDTPPHKRDECGSSSSCAVSGIFNNSKYNYLSYCHIYSVNRDRFTSDQKTRVAASLSINPRASLINSNGCIPVACSQTVVCNDNDPCTVDQCVSGSCVYTEKNCDDGDLCTTDNCVNGVCENIPVGENAATTFAGGTAQAGNMFDITATSAVKINYFSGNFEETSKFFIYYKTGSYVGFEKNAAAWTLVGSATNVPSAGVNIPSIIPIPVGINISAGQTVAFYITTDGSTFVKYTNSTGLGAVAAQTPELTVKNGNGISYPFGTIFTPRTWNGTLNYSLQNCVTQCIPCDDANPNTIDICDNGQCINTDTSCQTQTIALKTGWNMISSHIIPDAPAMNDVFQNVSDIIIVKDYLGKSYLPSFGINAIGNWNVHQGYNVKTSSEVTLNIGCQLADATLPMSVPKGWSIISYLPASPMNAVTAFASLGSDLIIAKDNNGKTYLPSFGLNSIGNLQPGQGYLVKMEDGGTLVYPAAGAASVEDEIQSESQSKHFICDLKTANNATIIFPADVLSDLANDGDEIAVVNSNGTIAGSAVINANNFSLTVWGDDASTTNTIDGFKANEKFGFKIWNKETGLEKEVTLEFSEGPGFFTANGISIIKKTEIVNSVLSIANELSVKFYPNPTAGNLTFEFFPYGSQSELFIFDIAGKEVKSEAIPANTSLFTTDISALAEGQYFFKIVAGKATAVGKAALSK